MLEVDDGTGGRTEVRDEKTWSIDKSALQMKDLIETLIKLISMYLPVRSLQLASVCDGVVAQIVAEFAHLSREQVAVIETFDGMFDEIFHRAGAAIAAQQAR